VIKFKPFGKKYDFKDSVLVKDYPVYMLSFLNDWLWEILNKYNVSAVSSDYLTNNTKYIKPDFINILRIKFREIFPQEWNDFVTFVFKDQDRTSNILAFCLQNYVDSEDAGKLEYILSQGGSAYEVSLIDKNAGEYDVGVYDLIERVSEIIKDQSQKALNSNELLQKAWQFCYSRNPDYEKTVINCQNFLEEFLRNKYEPSNLKPQLGKLIGNLKSASKKLKFKGETVLNNKQDVLLLLDNIPQFRGIHTAGTGKVPNKEEAEFVLHTTIYIWNIHQK